MPLVQMLKGLTSFAQWRPRPTSTQRQPDRRFFPLETHVVTAEHQALEYLWTEGLPRARDDGSAYDTAVVVDLADEAQLNASSPVSSEPKTMASKEKLSTGYVAIRNLLGIVERSSSAFPPLKGLVGCINALMDTSNAFSTNHQEFERLAGRVKLLNDIFAGRSNENLPQDIQDRRDGLKRSIEILARRLEEKTQRNNLDRAAYTAEDQQTIIELVREVTFSIELSMLDVTVNGETMVVKAVAGVDWLKEQAIEAMHKVSVDVAGIAKDVEALNKAELLRRLGNVKRFSFARGGRRKGCIPGSRITLLSQLMAWADDRGSKHVFWLSGMAGAGKTAVSETFCLELSKRGMLGASFFCSITDQDLSDVYHIIPSLAKVLAKVRPQFGVALATILEELHGDMDPLEMNLREQYNYLILRPADSAFTGEDRPIILCVDAIDECRESRALKDFLDAVVLSNPTSPIKIFLTSRPEDAIRERMESPEYSTHFQSLRLQDIEAHTVQSDIQLYIHRALEDIPVLRKHFKDNWPPPEVQRLVERSGELFIVAATLVRYIDNETGNRVERLLSCANPDTPLQSGVQSLYFSIMEKAFTNLSSRELEDTRSCLSLLVVAQRPLLVEEYGTLLNRPQSAVQEAFRPLYSVVEVEENRPVSIHHGSFVDFLTTYHGMHSNTQPLLWAIDRRLAHTMLVKLCLDLMNNPTKGIYFGISGASTSYRSNDEQKLGLRSDLAYACAEWGHHAIGAIPLNEEMEGELKVFLSAKVLYWVEALGVKKRVGTRSTGVLRELSKVTRCNQLTQMLTETQHFAAKWAAPINRSSPHLYLSVLPSCGSSIPWSYLQRSHFPSIPVFHVHGREASRDDDHRLTGQILVPSVDLHHSLAISPDGSTIVSGNSSGKLDLWNAISGERTMTLEGSSMFPIWSVSFSPDGSRLASGSGDKTVTVWDTQKGESVASSLSGHAGAVLSVAFSPDGTRIVSGSEDQTVWVWDSRTGTPVLGPLTGHTGAVNCVAFSPDGRKILSASSDTTIRTWDAHDGVLVGRPFEEHTGEVNSFAFLHGGVKIVSGSNDMTVRVWGAQSRESVMAPLEGHTNWVTAVAASGDGLWIASGSFDREIRLWDAHTGELKFRIAGAHESGIESSLAFSPDSAKLYSGSPRDSTIRSWNVRASFVDVAGADLKGRAGSINSLAFYPDGLKVVSGSSGSTQKKIQVWDINTGECIMDHPKPRKPLVFGLALSPNGSTIASGSCDDVIQTWDAQSGQHLRDFSLEEEAVKPTHPFWVRSVVFSPDGSQLAFRSRTNSLSVLDAHTGQLAMDTIVLGSPPDPEKRDEYLDLPLAFSPDGTTILAGSGDGTSVYLVDSKTGKQLSHPLEGHSRYITSVVFSPDGSKIASASYDNTIRIWDPLTKKSVSLQVPAGEAGSTVCCLAFSPNGSRITSGSYDNTVRVWDADTGTLVMGPLGGHTRRVKAVAFSPSGSEFISGSWDGTIRVWDANGSQTISPSTFLHYLPHNSIKMTEDGWICNTAGDLLLWVPPQFRPWIHMQPLKRIIAGPMIDIELTHARYHGPNWLKCKDPQSKESPLDYGEPWPVESE